MEHIAVIGAVGAFVVLIVLVELASAVLPLVILIACVPPHDRQALAELLAATDSSRKLRVGRALRVAIKARRAAIVEAAVSRRGPGG
jgi:hypothetical protein